MGAVDRLQGLAFNVAIKAPCLCVATTPITLNGAQTVDGVALTGNGTERVLVTAQADATTNGIYIANTSNWARDVDFVQPTDCAQGTIVVVTGGTADAETVWQLTTPSPVIGTTALNFSLMGAAALALASSWMRANFFPLTGAAAALAELGGVSGSGNNALTGTNDFTGGRIEVPTRASGDNGLDAASTAFVARAAAAAISPLTGGRNRLINGDFSIDQRNAGASQTFTAGAAIAYTVDRWYASCTGANITGQRVAGTSPNPYAYKFTGAASSTGLIFGQRIESANIADLVSGNVVVQIQAASSSIVSLTWTAYSANATDSFSSKTQIATGTIAIGATPTDYSFTFNAGTNAANGIAIEFSCGALLAAQTLQFEMAQLQSGTTAGAFERLSFNQRLLACQRYFASYSYSCGLFSAQGGNPNGTYGVSWPIAFPAVMRAAPTVTSTLAFSGGGASFSGVLASGVAGATLVVTATSGWSLAAVSGSLTANSEI